METEPSDSLAASLLEWRQGDVILGALVPFIHFADAATPLTEETRAAVGDNAASGEAAEVWPASWLSLGTRSSRRATCAS